MTSQQSNNTTTASQQATMEAIFENINQHLGQDLLWALLVTLGVAFAYRCTQSYQRRSRLVACLNSDTQRYFAIHSKWWSDVKYYLAYAPLCGSNHRATWVLGQPPTRFQALFLTAIIAVNAVFCFSNVPYPDPDLEVLAIVRSRTGTIAVANLVPIMIMSSVQNPFIGLLNVSYDSFNFTHRCFGRIAIIEAAIHTICHISSAVQRGGWLSFTKSTSDQKIWTGLVTITAFVAVLLQSPSVIRRAFYEAFLHIHIILVILVLIFLWMHLDGLPQRRLLLASIFLWVLSRLLRLTTLFYRSIGHNTCRATIEVLPHDTIRVTITNSRPFTYKPGQYVYLTVPSIGFWTAHPFSIAWSDKSSPVLSRQSSMSSQITTNHDVEKAVEFARPPTFSLVVRARDGFTRRLLAHTVKNAPAYLGHRVPVSCLIEGPYGLSRSLDSYGTVLLIAGGVGITHHIGYVRHLIQSQNEGISATRKVTLVWVVRRENEKEVVGQWMNEILNMEGRREVLRLEIYVTRGAVFESRSPSNSVFVRRGRPNLSQIVQREGERRLGCMVVSVCGPAGLQDDVRMAVRKEIKNGRNIEFVGEAFGW